MADVRWTEFDVKAVFHQQIYSYKFICTNPEALKTQLILKEKAKECALTVIKGTQIKIMSKGQRKLEAVIGYFKQKRE